MLYITLSHVMNQQKHGDPELTPKWKVWRTHMRARLSGQKGGQGLSVPVVGIQIHKYDWPGAALQSRNSQKRNHSSLYWLNNYPAFVRGKKPFPAKWLHSKALTCDQ